jgi:chromate transporter
LQKGSESFRNGDFLHVPFPLIVLAAGLTGLAATRLRPRLAQNKTKDLSESSGEDDDASRPAHTLPSRSRALRTLAAGLALWAVPLLALAGWRGWSSLHTQEYLFFTQAALVTFGGAYSVLAYVTQAAVADYGWLSQAEAVDGLALAETTPGPLIMVLQFVGFMAGWNHPQGLTPVASGITGALITTWTTFLPCFIFIFLGAPHIESLRGNENLKGALTSITAAIVGVILNLALIFGAAVIWPKGFGTDWFAAGMSVAAFAALFRLKMNVLWVVLIGGLIGLCRAAIKL